MNDRRGKVRESVSKAMDRCDAVARMARASLSDLTQDQFESGWEKLQRDVLDASAFVDEIRFQDMATEDYE